jgi:hypothetical protein
VTDAASSRTSSTTSSTSAEAPAAVTRPTTPGATKTASNVCSESTAKVSTQSPRTANAKHLDGLFNLLDPGTGLPARTTLRQQASFLLGYHHQRAEHFASIPAKNPSAATTTDTADTPEGTS